MEKVLQLKRYIDGVEDSLFPNKENPIIIPDFTYNAKRMGGVPTINATVMYQACLDDVWDDNVYVTFNGEKYFLKQTPTSSKNNTDARFKHELDFVSERINLDNVYFYDVVNEEYEDKPVSNSSIFTFAGDIIEFASKLKASLANSKLGYTVVVDEGISSETKVFTFSDTFFSNALQEAYESFDIPYYFDGKVIHFGYTTDGTIEEVFKYGRDNALLSITKSNRNLKLVNRITGVGSADNIPYYYPNDTPKGEIGIRTLDTNLYLSASDIVMSKPVDTANKLSFLDNVTFEVSGTKANLNITKKFLQDDGEYHNEDEYPTNTTNNSYYYVNNWYHHTGHVGVLLNVEATSGGEAIVECSLYLNELSPEKAVNNLYIAILENNGVDERSYEPTIIDKPLEKYFAIDLGKTTVGKKYEILIDYDITRYDYTAENDAWFADFQANSETSNSTIYRWRINNYKIVTLEELGITIDSEDFNNNPDKYHGEGFGIEQIKYITPTTNLMPSIYRETDGKERFYNALNGTYTQDEGDGYYEFNHPYVDGQPREHIQNFEDIKPSIVGMTNAEGQRMDMFLEFAYDTYDNDERDEEGNYKHPYFFAKLPKYDGDYGFNLFEQAIDEDEMTISMVTGNCAACNFVIAVGENTQKNLVQVDENGQLKRDSNGNVLCTGVTPQEKQNDTRTNEVWIALKKDYDTFGTLLPAGTQKPSVNDTFVILHIDMPKAYILAAEERLERMLIQYMSENNDERFDFSISFSRIYFAENPSILKSINENARLNIDYNGTEHILYVSSFQYKMNSKEYLPEITVELSDELTISQNAIQNAISDVKNEMLYRLGNIDWLAIGQKYFLRKDSTSDVSKAKTNFRDTVTFGTLTQGNSTQGEIEPTGNATFNKLNVNDVNAKGDVTFGKYQTGLMGHGGRITPTGSGELRSLKLWEWLEVPELRYNRVSINVGFDFDTKGGGIIDTVTPDYDEEGNILESGTCTLKLEDGEAGAIAVGDLCMGMWHDTKGGNATEDSDDRKGSFTRGGFKTIYFQITGVSTSDNSEFTYKLRPTNDDGGGNGIHPYSQMHFAQRGNIKDTDRQAFRYTTTEYTVSLQGVSTWEFSSSNIYEIRGKLDGFSMKAYDKEGNEYTKVFSGYGQVFGNAYMYGTLNEFDKVERDMQLTRTSNGTLASDESDIITVAIKENGSNIVKEYTLTITRNSGDTDADDAWAESYDGYDEENRTFTITYADLNSDNDIFTITATKANVSGETDVLSGMFTVAKHAIQEVYMGFWDSAITYKRTSRTYPTVTHLGSKWYLMASSSCGDEPMPMSDVWGLVNGSTEMAITFSNSSNFVVLLNNVNTIVTLHVMLGFNDVTEQILSQPTTILNWSRNSGDSTSDYSWNPTIPDLTTGGVIINPTTLQKRHLWLRHNNDYSDLGLKWHTTRTCTFTAQIILPNGEAYEADIEVSL